MARHIVLLVRGTRLVRFENNQVAWNETAHGWSGPSIAHDLRDLTSADTVTVVRPDMHGDFSPFYVDTPTRGVVEISMAHLREQTTAHMYVVSAAEAMAAYHVQREGCPDSGRLAVMIVEDNANKRGGRIGFWRGSNGLDNPRLHVSYYPGSVPLTGNNQRVTEEGVVWMGDEANEIGCLILWSPDGLPRGGYQHDSPVFGQTFAALLGANWQRRVAAYTGEAGREALEAALSITT